MSTTINGVTKLAILGLILAITFGVGIVSELHQAHAVKPVEGWNGIDQTQCFGTCIAQQYAPVPLP